jgi:hypothetical protein
MAMRIRRGPLFWGLLLIPLGGIPLLVRAGILDATAFTDAWRLWPLIIVGIGLAILLGRTRAGVVGTVVLALVLGVAGGGALAAGNLWVGGIDCVASSGQMSQTTDTGTFTSPASVELDLACGSADVTTHPADEWTLDAAHKGAPPTVSDSASSLRIASPDGLGPHREEWTIGLPAASTRDIDLTANAASTSFDLEGAALRRFGANINAGDLRVDASGGSVSELDVSINAGRARVTLGTGSTTGSVSANAGAIELCVPRTAGLVLRVTDQLTFAHNLDDRGLTRDGNTWTRAGASDQTVDLRVEGNATSFTLDPDGGC